MMKIKYIRRYVVNTLFPKSKWKTITIKEFKKKFNYIELVLFNDNDVIKYNKNNDIIEIAQRNNSSSWNVEVLLIIDKNKE